MAGTQLHIYYGAGKGKTTAALGQAVRAWGRGWRVLFAQFLKDSRARSGEAAAARLLGPRFKLLRLPQPAPVLRDPGPAGRRLLRAACVELMRVVEAEVARRRYQVVVLDEALVACHYRLLTARAVLAFRAAAAGRGVQVVVATGRWAPAGLLRAADLASELRNHRHPYDRGVPAAHGIDY